MAYGHGEARRFVLLESLSHNSVDRCLHWDLHVKHCANRRRMPTPSSGRESRRASKSSATPSEAQKSSDRREKAKSGQIYDSRRRPSRQAESSLSSASARPQLKGRTNSAPLIDRGAVEPGALHGNEYGGQTGPSSNASTTPRVGSRVVDAQDEDEVAGVVGAVKNYQPFKSFEVQYP